ncbi:MAG: TolC family protein [Deltaproteobacteria bacterium]|nr:TolC family protein [Deltaproteobacteria bacterium]
MLGRIAAAAAVLASMSGPANAEEAAASIARLTVAEFLTRVEAADPRFEMLEGDVAAQEAAVTVAGLWGNPSLAYDREEIAAGGRSFPENTIRLQLPLELSGRRGLRVEGAKLGAGAARQTALRAKQGILLDALDVYLRAAAARVKLTTLLEEHDSLDRLVVAVKARAAAGEASGYDLDRLALEADTLDDLVADCERELLAWRRALGLLSGAPESRFDANDELNLPAVPGPVSKAALLAARPDYEAAGLRVAQAEMEIAAAGRGWVPGVSLSGGAKSAVFGADPRWGYVAGAALSLPFLDHDQADRERARARLRIARAERRLIEHQVMAQASTSSESLARVVSQAQQFEANQVSRLDRLVKRAETSYQEGERPIFELLDAYRTARATRLRVIELRLQARQAELEVWRARGVGPGGHP